MTKYIRIDIDDHVIPATLIRKSAISTSIVFVSGVFEQFAMLHAGKRRGVFHLAYSNTAGVNLTISDIYYTRISKDEYDNLQLKKCISTQYCVIQVDDVNRELGKLKLVGRDFSYFEFVNQQIALRYVLSTNIWVDRSKTYQMWNTLPTQYGCENSRITHLTDDEYILELMKQ